MAPPESEAAANGTTMRSAGVDDGTNMEGRKKSFSDLGVASRFTFASSRVFYPGVFGVHWLFYDELVGGRVEHDQQPAGASGESCIRGEHR